MIADYFGAELAKVEEHVAVRHRLKGNAPWNGRTVNSFHNMAVKAVADNLIIEARSEDGVIEAIRVRNKKIYGTMWHPERERPYEKDDIQFIKHIFSKRDDNNESNNFSGGTRNKVEKIYRESAQRHVGV